MEEMQRKTASKTVSEGWMYGWTDRHIKKKKHILSIVNHGVLPAARLQYINTWGAHHVTLGQYITGLFLEYHCKILHFLRWIDRLDR